MHLRIASRLGVLSGVLSLAVLAGSAGASAAPPPRAGAAQEPRDVTVLVGAGQDTAQVFSFFPLAVRVRVGDTVTWKINGDELHTAAFIAGTTADPRAGGIQNPLGPGGGDLIPGFFAPLPGGAPDDLMINPQTAFPTRAPGAPVETYRGTGFLNSGFLEKQPPLPEIPLNQTFSVTFDTPGTFPYLCLVHPDRMLGTVEVVPVGGGPVPSQEEIDARGQAEMAPLLALVAQAKGQGETLRRSEPGPGGTAFWFVRAGNTEFLSGEPRAQMFDFLPKDVTVRSGDTVIWGSNYFHSVTFNPTPPPPDFLQLIPQPDGPPLVRFNPLVARPAKPAPAFDPAQYYTSADLGPFSPGGFSWALTFERPGTFEYFCAFHQQFGMKGTVTVVSR